MLSDEYSPELIKQIRYITGWSQERLARHLEVAFNSVNRWELGVRVPARSTRKTIVQLHKNLLFPHHNTYANKGFMSTDIKD